MGFTDVSARFKKKKQEEEAALPPRDFEELHTVRARIIGVLMRDARQANGTTQIELAKLINVSEDVLRDWEYGRGSPSLPQLEMIAFHLGIPVSRFWSDKTLGTEQDARIVSHADYSELRNRMIGAKLTMAREDARLTRERVAAATGLPVERIAAYELGTQTISFAELAGLASAVNKSMSFFLEESDRIGGFLALQEEFKHFSALPDELRAFIAKSTSVPFLEIAFKLSKMPVEELRSVGAHILDITF